MEMIYPRPVGKGAKVAVISPATVVKAEYVEGAAAFLRGRGLTPVVMPHALGPADGTYAASESDRLSDWLTALQDPEIDAILCARGGYGCVHLVAQTPLAVVRENPKWVVGFSDVSALHALMWRARVASVHGPMAKHLTLCPGSEATAALMSLLEKGLPLAYEVEGDERNQCGRCRGRLLGGNLAVLGGLAGTPLDLLGEAGRSDVVLFIEDISEAVYRVERMLWMLHLSGALGRVKGIIVGQFTDYRPDTNFGTVEKMISTRLAAWALSGVPVAFNFPVGHVDYNLPLVEGCMAELEVARGSVTLKMMAQ